MATLATAAPGLLGPPLAVMKRCQAPQRLVKWTVLPCREGIGISSAPRPRLPLRTEFRVPVTARLGTSIRPGLQDAVPWGVEHRAGIRFSAPVSHPCPRSQRGGRGSLPAKGRSAPPKCACGSHAADMGAPQLPRKNLWPGSHDRGRVGCFSCGWSLTVFN